MFNRGVVASLESDDPGSSLVETRDKLVLRLNTLAGMVTKPLRSYQRHSVEALITIVVHARDILNNMIEEKVHHSDDFEWTRYLGFLIQFISLGLCLCVCNWACMRQGWSILLQVLFLIFIMLRGGSRVMKKWGALELDGGRVVGTLLKTREGYIQKCMINFQFKLSKLEFSLFNL